MRKEDFLVPGLLFVAFGILLYISSRALLPSIFLVAIGVLSVLYIKLSSLSPNYISTKQLKKSYEKSAALEDEILNIIREKQGILQTELISKLDLPRSEVYKILEKLEQDQKIERVKEGRTYRLYAK